MHGQQNIKSPYFMKPKCSSPHSQKPICPHPEPYTIHTHSPLFIKVLFNNVFCSLCISMCVCNETNLMHYLSSVYSVTIPLHVLGLLAAHHQEVTLYLCDSWYVLYVLVDCQLAYRQSTKTYVYKLPHMYIATF
jgi:hypothetical protein